MQYIYEVRARDPDTGNATYLFTMDLDEMIWFMCYLKDDPTDIVDRDERRPMPKFSERDFILFE